MNGTFALLAGTSVAGLVAFGAPAVPAHADDAQSLRPVVAAGSYQPVGSGGPALTYDEQLVPVGAHVQVVSTPMPLSGTWTVLAISGLRPDREYGAHVHVLPCGPTGDHAGSHFQHVVDPVQPSTDPAYANPENEIWLDFSTDADGTGHAVSRVPWTFDERRAGSVVVHEHHTHTGHGDAGSAGDRLACLTVQF